MENKAHAIAAGAFVLGLVAVLIALVVWLTRDDTVRNIYELSTRDAVSGLQPQATVRYRGIAVGKVVSIDFDPKVKGNVRVRITVDKRVPLTASSYATLSYQGVTGLAFIAIDDKGESQVALVPNDEAPPRIPLRPSMLAQLQDRGELIISQIDEVTKRANTLLGDANQKRIADALENIAEASASANQLTRSLDNTVKTGLNPALAALPPLVDRTRDTMATLKAAGSDVSRVANNFNTTVSRLNAPDGPIDRLGNGTKALSQAVESFNSATLPRVNRVADDTSRAVRRLGRAADGISDNPQSLLFGNGGVVPGPGEAGFTAPAPATARPSR
ncbi:MAG: MlaD family protein [Variovorax sp.]